MINWRTWWSQLPHHTVLVVLAVLSLLPLAMMVLISAKDPAQLFTRFWSLPDPIRWSNYAFGWDVVARYIFNSVVVTVATCGLVIGAAAPAAFALSRMDFIGRRVVYLAIVALLMVPGVFMLVPLFLTVRSVGLLNSYPGLILPQVAGGLPLAVFLFYGFFAQLPRDLFDAARIDGASEWRVLVNLVMPLSMPVVSTVAILVVLASWNNYLWPLLCIRDETLRTLPVGLAFLWTEQNLRFNPEKEMAAYVIGALPLVLCFLLAMRPFMRGLSSGALKG
jgi:ABC-type glycerol-3-phosphate transport system permease component